MALGGQAMRRVLKRSAHLVEGFVVVVPVDPEHRYRAVGNSWIEPTPETFGGGLWPAASACAFCGQILDGLPWYASCVDCGRDWVVFRRSEWTEIAWEGMRFSTTTKGVSAA